MPAQTSPVCGITLLAIALCLPATSMANVDLLLLPSSQTVTAGDVVSIELIALADATDDEAFVALDAILSWDPNALQLLGVDDSGAGYDWFFSGFPPNGDLNQGLSEGVPANDGDALYSALAQLGEPAVAPGTPGPGLLVTTLEFRALTETALTTLSFLPSCCDPDFDNSTRVLTDEPWPATDITGDISSQAHVTIEPPEASLTLETMGGCQPGVGPGDVITVELWMRDLTQNVTVFVAFVGYDTDKLLFRSDLSEYTSEPFPAHFITMDEAETVPGEIDLEGHTSLSDPDGTDQDAPLALLRFEVLPGWECTATTVFFRPDGPSRVSYQGTPTQTELFDSPGFWVDVTPPEFSDCPESTTLPSAPGQCGAIATWPPVTATDNCDGPLTPIATHESGAFFPVGVTTVTITATDDCGNVATCSFTVSVLDVEAPLIMDCPDDILAYTEPGDLTAEVAWIAPVATDNCDGEFAPTGSRSDSLPLTDPFPVGTTTVTYSATDAAGNPAEPCVFLVTVVAVPPLCAGDMNCDGMVNFDDIDPFVAALGCSGGDPDCWDPACPWLNGDTNGDETVNFDDIDPFVARLGATCP